MFIFLINFYQLSSYFNLICKFKFKGFVLYSLSKYINSIPTNCASFNLSYYTSSLAIYSSFSSSSHTIDNSINAILNYKTKYSFWGFFFFNYIIFSHSNSVQFCNEQKFSNSLLIKVLFPFIWLKIIKIKNQIKYNPLIYYINVRTPPHTQTQNIQYIKGKYIILFADFCKNINLWKS